MSKIVFVDTETTSLRPDRRVWDLGMIIRDENGEREFSCYVDAEQIDLVHADPMALRIGHFYERHPEYSETVVVGRDGPVDTTTGTSRGYVLGEVSMLRVVEQETRGAILVGAVPNFDTEVLGARMRARGILPSWHYHLVDVETLAAGALKLAPPWNFDTVLQLYGLTYAEEDRHTALGDARMARDLYDAVLAGTEAPKAAEA